MKLHRHIAGVDEAGRGPLAGPVMAAAVILDPSKKIPGLDDSKKLSVRKRSTLEKVIKISAVAWSVANSSVEEIDELNILQASLLAMRRAVESLNIKPDYARIDGNKIPSGLICPAEAIVKGDSLHSEISAASILAKEARDRDMIALSKIFPYHGFDLHKGYPTKIHLEALQTYGVTKHHRKNFNPVSRLIP